MLKKGDRYVRFTNYGGVNFGTVKSIWNAIVIDIESGCKYLAPHLVSQSGLSFDMAKDGRFYKVEKEYTEKEIEAIREMNKRLAGMTKHERISEMLKGVKLPNEKINL